MIHHLGEDLQDLVVADGVLALPARGDIPVLDRSVDQPKRADPAFFLRLHGLAQRGVDFFTHDSPLSGVHNFRLTRPACLPQPDDQSNHLIYLLILFGRHIDHDAGLA